MATPSVAADTPQVELVRGAHADYELRLDMEGLEENATLATRQPDPCTSGSFEVEPELRQFEFTESRADGGCGEIGHPLTLPSADQIYIVFLANRSFQQETASTPIDAVQDLRVYDEKNQLVHTYPYISPSSGAVSDEVVFLELGQLGLSRLNVSWFFEDRGYSPAPGLNFPVGHRYEAIIREPRLVVQNAALPWFDLGSNENVVNDTLVHRTFIQVNLQSVVGQGAANFTVRILTNPNATVEEIRTPDGASLDLARLSSRIRDDGYEIQVSEGDVAGHGLGNLILVMRTEAPVPPALAQATPNVSTPPNLLPFAMLLIGLPAIPAVLATRSSLGLRRTADVRHRPFVTHVFGVDLAFFILYIGLFIYVLTGQQLPRMASLPLTLEAWVLYAEFILLTLLFVFLWVAPTRHLVELMRRDLIMSEKAQAQLRRSNAELEQFAYVASHDLQEPLRTIAGFSEILRTKYGKQLDAKAQQYLAMNAQGAKRMQTLINGLLAYSRVESHPLEKVPVDLGVVMSDVVRDVERLRQEQNGTIEVDPLPVITADPVQMRQLFLNLVQNALKYRHAARPPHVWVGAETDKDHHIVWVRDNGRGIEGKYHEQIFDMFQRLEPRDSSIEGTGLGLAVVKKIVARHDGRVWVESIPGGGSIFKVALPVR